MKLEVRKARAAAVAANLAAQAAVAARELLAEDPSAWEVGDAAYWLCRAAQKACESAADALDPEEAETNANVFAARIEDRYYERGGTRCLDLERLIRSLL